MDTSKSFPQLGFLHQLESGDKSDLPLALPAPLARALKGVEADGHAAAASLISLLRTRQAVWQAAVESDAVADALRRYQKFARPGPPSAHIVQLRQQQASVRRASSQARQAYVATAAAFVRAVGITVPPRVALEAFINHWIDANVPRDAAAASA